MAHPVLPQARIPGQSITPSPARPNSVAEFLLQQQNQDLLRFITCGSVDDGKSTLIGRLLWESQQLFDDQLTALRTESRKIGTQGNDLDFALLVDGLAAEREQGITIDVAYRFFASARRKFIVADTPGHEQYTRNMVTGASTADVAVLLFDARQGMLTQTRRHAYIASIMGIQHVVLAINKMDLVDFSASTFTQIEQSFRQFAESLAFKSISAIPLSALLGDNITAHSENTPWYGGPTLMGYLETVKLAAQTQDGPDKLVFPVQWVNRPNGTFRGFSGSVAQGHIKVGDEIRVTSSGQTACVAEIVTMDGPLDQALAGDAVTLRLTKEIDASRGDILSLSQTPIESTDQFEATLVWMHEDAGLPGRSYDIKLATQWASASISSIRHQVNINTLCHDASTQLELNDIGVCNIALSKPLAFDSYKNSRTLGGFILVDRFSHATVAAGMIHHGLRGAQNIHQQALAITCQHYEHLNAHKGGIIWITGISSSDKFTQVNALEVALQAQGKRTFILDGDNVRQGLNKDLGFTATDCLENIRRIAEIAKLLADADLWVLVLASFISPLIDEREMARSLFVKGDFLEVFVG